MTPRKSLLRHVACSLSLALSVVAHSAHADEPDARAKAQAETLFNEGRTLLDAGDIAAACPKLEAAVSLTQGEALGGKLVLARCYERAGRLASALGLYGEVAARAEAAGQSERASEARARREALQPKVHTVKLDVAAEALALSDLSVRVAGVEQPRAAWSMAIPVDAGEVVVLARATGRRDFSERLTIPREPGETRVAISLAALGDVQSVEQKPERGAPQRAPEPASFWSAQRIAGLALGAFGVASAGAGFAIGGVAKSNYDDGLTTGHCSGSPPVCDDTTPLDDARTQGDVATGVIFGGLGVLAVGVVVFATAPMSEPETTASLRLAPNGAALQVVFQ